MAFIALRAYARRRAVRLSAVQKAIESRRVHGAAIREEGGRITGIDPELADQQWAQNTDPVEAARSGKLPPAAVPVAPAPGATLEKPAAELAGDQGNFLAARLKGVELDNRMKELNELERVGVLVARAVVNQEFSEIFSQLKSAVFRVPDRKAQALAAETDPVRVHRMLSDELRTIFDEFSRQLTEPAAGMADDADMAAERAEVLP